MLEVALVWQVRTLRLHSSKWPAQSHTACEHPSWDSCPQSLLAGPIHGKHRRGLAALATRSVSFSWVSNENERWKTGQVWVLILWRQSSMSRTGPTDWQSSEWNPNTCLLGALLRCVSLDQTSWQHEQIHPTTWPFLLQSIKLRIWTSSGNSFSIGFFFWIFKFLIDSL